MVWGTPENPQKSCWIPYLCGLLRSHIGSGARKAHRFRGKPGFAAMSTAEVSEDKGSHIWTLLPTFDPATDNVKEYIEKVKFIDNICPKKDRPMLAPRLAMLCRGTAWGQVKNLQSEELTDPVNGVKNLLAALSTWEESTEMKTYEQFERAIYKTDTKLFRKPMNPA